MKRMFSIIMVAILIFACTSVTVFASDTEIAQTTATSGDFRYIVLPDGTAEIVDYLGTQQALTIPSTLDEYTVTSIGREAFGYNLYPEPVGSIAQTGESYYVSLSEVVIPSTVTNIGERAFYYCRNLAEVTIPSSVTSIGGEAFYETPWLEKQKDGCVYINNVLYCYKGDMPENTQIKVKEGTRQICGYAFMYYSNLSSIEFPDSLISIGDFSFYNCSGLTDAPLPDSVVDIGYYAFCGCTNLTQLKIPSSLTCIDGSAFESCESITEVVIPESVTTINGSAFRYCKNLSAVTIPPSVTSVGLYAFAGTPWLNNQADGCIYINNTLYAYKGKMPQDTEIVIKEGTTDICHLAFYQQKNLTGVKIPSSVTSIGVEAFRYCPKLEFVRIEDTVKDIGTLAFSEGIKIYGTEGSAAEKYSKTPRFRATFVLIGDADSDKSITIIDVTEIQRIIAQLSVVNDFNATDFDGDGEITVLDATAIQMKLAHLT